MKNRQQKLALRLTESKLNVLAKIHEYLVNIHLFKTSTERNQGKGFNEQQKILNL